MYYAFPIVTAIMFLIFAIIWKKDDGLNLIIKIMLFIMLAWACLDAADRLEYLDSYRQNVETKPITTETRTNDHH